jgi:hypothetical protein
MDIYYVFAAIVFAALTILALKIIFNRKDD